jgi:hypothetical protein
MACNCSSVIRPSWSYVADGMPPSQMACRPSDQKSSILRFLSITGIARMGSLRSGSHFGFDLFKAGLESFGLATVVVENHLNQERLHEPGTRKIINAVLSLCNSGDIQTLPSSGRTTYRARTELGKRSPSSTPLVPFCGSRPCDYNPSWKCPG